ncbi:cell division protein FtsQ [Bartonella henselae]|nr:cell division protein FtsQ/DivIB [Bartonella henselae]AAP32280.1 FtsQ [Bartonella henselae str. Houston-1]ATP12611.1 cell division protein FtsQ [Bartonella henselae]MDM9990377.1 FtsQ-type POTRA domain-containing protein [Bartonella henselae]OLL38518.1 cell division protein FtsQ [Bartonella henselae]OLL41909.1 cell division protein FtsQ [Bartonella henselae]
MYALNVDKTNIPMVVLSVPVLPRLYRRFLRFMFEFVFVRIHVPRHFGSFAVLFFFSLTLLYGFSLSGRVEMIVKTALSDIGFVVTDVDMSGNKRVVKQEILKILGLDTAPSIFTFNVDRARSLLEQKAWIQSANVQKIYPNRVRISVVERKPYAIWQHDGMMDIVDSTGRVIAPFQTGIVQNLPLVVGQGAQNAAKGFLQALSVYPKVYDHVRAYVRVGDRRWDLILDNGVRVLLPENGAFERLDSLIESATVQNLFSRDVLRVDLRLPDRITVALSDEVLERHRAFVAEEQRVLKARKAGKL